MKHLMLPGLPQLLIFVNLCAPLVFWLLWRPSLSAMRPSTSQPFHLLPLCLPAFSSSLPQLTYFTYDTLRRVLYDEKRGCEAAALGVHSTPSQTCILFAMPHATHASAKPPQAPYQHGTTSTHSRTKVIRGDCRPRVTDGSSLQPGQHPRQSATHTVHRQLCMNSGFQ